MAFIKGHTGSVAAVAVLGFILLGCASPDHRLAEDQRSCEGMGHVVGTTGFRTCMADLNDRRCARGGPRNGSTHVATAECTRLD